MKEGMTAPAFGYLMPRALLRDGGRLGGRGRDLGVAHPGQRSGAVGGGSRRLGVSDAPGLLGHALCWGYVGRERRFRGVELGTEGFARCETERDWYRRVRTQIVRQILSGESSRVNRRCFCKCEKETTYSLLTFAYTSRVF